jgi:inorganic pyrophosphatase/exopolyphosphatase
MLLGAIISNTINFKNKVTTARDIKAADEIREILDIKSNFVKQMFAYKSHINNSNLEKALDHELYVKKIGNRKIAITQIEITDLEKMVSEYKPIIKRYLQNLIEKDRVDYALFTGIDIYEGFNIFMTADNESNKFFSKVLGIEKIQEGYKTKEIIMRKEILAKIEL